MRTATVNDLKPLFPFRGQSEEVLAEILRTIKTSIRSYSSGEVIIDRDNGERALCFVLSGECEVGRKRSHDEIMPVKLIKPNESFGIISVFSDKEKYPTIVKAKVASEILSISRDSFILITKKFPDISTVVIEFLCDRIEYLNDSLSTFCAKSAEVRLARKLLLLREDFGDEIHLSMTRLSNEIGIGRASLYRILLDFENKELVRTDKKTIIIINPKGLEEIK